KICATISPALLSLLERNLIDLDYIEVNGERDVETLRRALSLRPVLLHDISYHHLPIQARDLDLLRWTLERVPKLAAITLESRPPSEEALMEEVRLVRQVVGKKPNAQKRIS